MDYFWGYWWVIVPVGYFVFRAWVRWLSYLRSRHALEVMKHYAAQGKDPPPELVAQVQDDAYGYDGFRGPWRYRRYWRGDRPWYGAPPPDPAHPANSAGPASPVGPPVWRRGSYWEWRAVVVVGAVAAGFWFASEYVYIPDAEGPFRLVAIILTCVAAANLALALMSSRFRDPRDK